MFDTGALKQTIKMEAVETAKAAVLAINGERTRQSINAKAECHTIGHQAENGTLPETTSFRLELKRQIF